MVECLKLMKTSLHWHLTFPLAFFLATNDHLTDARDLFSVRPSVTREGEVDMSYLDRIHTFLGEESSNLRMASVICFLYLFSVIMEDHLLPMEIQVRTLRDCNSNTLTSK